MDYMSSVSLLKGIGEKTTALFNKLGVYTVKDILLFLPRTYLVYEKPSPVNADCNGQIISISARAKCTPLIKRTRTIDVTTLTVYVDEVPVDLVWFRAPYIRNQIEPGKVYIFYGRLLFENGRFKMKQPLIYSPEKYQELMKNIQPVYRLTKGLSNNLVIKAVKEALSQVKLLDGIPQELLQKNRLMEYNQALNTYHFPETYQGLKEARRRLCYNEFFYFILNSRLLENKGISYDNAFDIKHHAITDDFVEKLPFSLTKDQENVGAEILSDLTGPYVSQRLIQGDVGSGKTVVAFIACLDVALSGYQAAIMAPTEVLARQHYENFSDWCKNNNIDIPLVLFSGSQKASEKKQMQAIVDANKACIIVGTHALITGSRTYSNLALVIVDEQHRFGVNQRQALSDKGSHPHLIVMSATPIPRTLAMILYGNMHVSVIKSMPADRLPIKTSVVKEHMRSAAYKFIEKELGAGHQAYIICPLVEASETTEAENVMDYGKKLSAFFKDRARIAILHGKMKPSEKNEIMDAFARHDVDILVSTTVVEVGVNVPNATVIMIENANRFGLAALHQLRGRVGRGSAQSYCILMNSSSDSSQSKRLETMLKSNDGFFIAKEDLKLRGPGDLFGVRQSGEFSFQIADIYTDAEELTMADNDVNAILKEDPELEKHSALKSSLMSFITDQSYVL